MNLRKLLLALAALVAGACSVVLAGPPDSGPDTGTDLRLVMIVSRHGVRPPLANNARLDKLAAQPWPAWEVPPAFLTPHGAQLITQMGAYYRALYLREGLLTGDAAADASHVSYRADNDERTIESARRLGLALVPGSRPEVRAQPAGAMDPLFRPAVVGHPDAPTAMAAALGRVGHDLPAVLQAHRAALDLMQTVLFGAGGNPPAGKISPLAAAPFIGRAKTLDGLITIEPLHTCMSLTEDFLLEYENGKPMADVGWGRVTPDTLTRLLELHSLYWDLTQRTFYIAQASGSNLASHLLSTLDQAVSGRPEEGALGRLGDRIVVVMGHDTNLVNLSGLMGVSWIMPGLQMNTTLPGGALVFELRQRRSDRQFLVRVQYVSQSLEQMRQLEPLSLQAPPVTAPIFIPGCSESGAGSDAPYAKFKAMMDRVIDPRFVEDQG